MYIVIVPMVPFVHALVPVESGVVVLWVLYVPVRGRSELVKFPPVLVVGAVPDDGGAVVGDEVVSLPVRGKSGLV